MNGEMRYWLRVFTFRIFRDCDKSMLRMREKARRVNRETKMLLEAINNNHKVEELDD